MGKKMQDWEAKYHARTTPETKRVEKAFADMREGALMLIPTPKQIEDFIRTIPQGTVMDMKSLRDGLAAVHGADHTCPLTTGIFLRTVAEAGYARWQRTGRPEDMPPVWRVMDERSPVAQKLSFGFGFLRECQAAEQDGPL